MPDISLYVTTEIQCPERDVHHPLEVGDDGDSLCLHFDTSAGTGAFFAGDCLFSVGEPAKAVGPYLYLVGFPAAPADLVDFDAWYGTEHLDLLGRHPAWRGCQLYSGQGAAGMTRLAIHHWADTSPRGSREQAAARATPWRAQMADHEWFQHGTRLLAHPIASR